MRTEVIEKNQYTAKVVIATHKEYKMPSDRLYLPLQVGVEISEKNEKFQDFGYLKDNVGENISELNDSFCELTALYWAWKNLELDYIGLVHYRRHFSMKRKSDFEKLLTMDELSPYLGSIKIFVPNKRHYYIETLYSHYKHTHYAEELNETKRIIEEKYPEYLDSYNNVVKHTYGYMFNMMIMERTLLDEYCKWLFDILFELKKRIDMTGLDTFQKRFFGRISEIIFNVWLHKKLSNNTLRSDEIKEIPCVHMESINWRKKGMAFLKAKFWGEKYTKSF